MPYRKDNIGATPYFVTAYETRFFRLATCERIYNSLLDIGIEVHKASGVRICELTYLDSYSTYVKELSKPLTTLKTFTTAYL